MNDTFPVIDGHTKLTGLLGSPVSHSISPLMHNEAFRLLNLNYVYLCFDVPEANLADTVKGLRCMNIAGFNCTMPDKTKICELIDDLSDAARMIGAVNTVVNKNGRLVGHNTDGIGYMQAVKEAGHDIIGKEMTLLGAGGAATAIAVQAALDGVSTLHIFNRKGRSWERALKLADTINANTSCKATVSDLADEASLRQALEADQRHFPWHGSARRYLSDPGCFHASAGTDRIGYHLQSEADTPASDGFRKWLCHL